MRPTVLALFVPALLVAPLALSAQAPAQATAATSATALPTGWSMRLDRDGAKTDGLKFVAMGTGYHVTTGPAAIFYDATRKATGRFTAQASFTQTRAPMHAEAYGLVVGGSNLDTPQQDYLYFVVRGDGKYLVKHRAGAEVHTLQDWTAHASVKAADAAGKATNALRVQVASDSVRFAVNGTQVFALRKVAFVKTDGIVGLRVNHQLDVHVDGFTVTPTR